MMRTAVALFLLAAAASAQTVDQLVDRELPSLVATYKQLHAAPELSMQEKKSSEFVASQLRALGFEVTHPFGQYSDPGATCYGVVAVMKNGKGPMVLVRADMDGLPVTEQTGVAWTSQNAGV